MAYSNNKKVGKAKVVITAKGSKYKGKITKTFKIVPKKPAVPKVKTGKKKITVTAKTKVSGKKYYGAWSKIKTTAKVR